MAYTALTTVNTSDVANASWANLVKDDLDALKARQVSLYPHGISGDFANQALGGHFAVLAGSAASAGALAFDEWMVPSDFNTLTKAVIRAAAGEDGNLRYSVGTGIGDIGSSYTAGQVAYNTTATLAVNSFKYFEIDISSLLPASSLSPDQTVSMYIQRIANSSLDTIDSLYVFGAYILYNP